MKKRQTQTLRGAALLALAWMLASPAQAQTAIDEPPARTAPESAKPAPAAVPADPTSAKARKLLDEMVAALGGDAWKSFSTRVEQGRGYSFYHGKPTSEGTVYRGYYEYPDKMRRELPQSREKLFLDSGLGLPVPVIGGKSKDIVYIYNGDKGYEITFRGTAPQDAKTMQEIIRRRDHSLDVVIREWLKDPQAILFYVGRSVVDQQMVDVVSILNGKNDEVRIGIEINSRLPINVSYTWRDADKYKVEDEVIFGNYRKVDGIQTPYTITRRRDGEISGQQFLNRVQYNQKFSPDFFAATVTYDPAKGYPDGKK